MADRYSEREQVENAIEIKYRQRYATEPLRDIIVFRSGPHAMDYVSGMDFADNARALFEYMLSVGLNEKYQLVWVVRNPREYESRFADVSKVQFVSWDWAASSDEKLSAKYYEPLCTAKYFFFTDAYGFVRNARSDQVRVQLWHGCGFKTRVNFSRCENRYEYNTVISDLYRDIHAKIYGLRLDQVLVTGQPKGDWIYHPIPEWKSLFSIPEAEKYIFWLPTFRKTSIDMLDQYDLAGEVGLPAIESMQQLSAINGLLAANDTVLVIKLHPFQFTESMSIPKLSNVVLIENKDLFVHDLHINQLLGHADALISDYSSAAVDYLLLNRPVGFVIDDIEEYESSRGFVFDNVRDWMFGAEIKNNEDLVSFLQEVTAGIDSTKEKRETIRVKMHKYLDDGSCKRIVDEIVG